MRNGRVAGGPEVSVVIPTFRRPELVLRAVRSLVAQTLAPERFEVLVAIDGREPATREALEMLGTPFVLRVLEGPKGARATACNRGVAAARGRLVVILDDDMEPAPECLEAHVRFHAAAPGPRCAVGAAPIRTSPTAPPLQRFVADLFARRLAHLAEPGRRFAVRDFYSGHCSLPRQALRDAGGFDEEFTAYGNEDYELSVRLAAAGVEIAFLADAVAYQTWDKSLARFARDNLERGRTAVLLATKHPDALPQLTLSRYDAVSPRWRAVRRMLLAATRRVPAVPRLVLAAVRLRERLGGSRPDGWYAFTLDYLYWAGAESAGWDPRRGRGLRA